MSQPLGYNPRVVGHQPCTTYQSIDKCHTQLSPSRSNITGQTSSVHRGVQPIECLTKLQPSTLPLSERGILYHSKFIMELLKLQLGKGLGENIYNLLICRKVLHQYFFPLHHILNVMKIDLNMFRSVMRYWIL
jgi:hypothetical protein